MFYKTQVIKLLISFTFSSFFILQSLFSQPGIGGRDLKSSWSLDFKLVSFGSFNRIKITDSNGGITTKGNLGGGFGIRFSDKRNIVLRGEGMIAFSYNTFKATTTTTKLKVREFKLRLNPSLIANLKLLSIAIGVDGGINLHRQAEFLGAPNNFDFRDLFNLLALIRIEIPIDKRKLFSVFAEVNCQIIPSNEQSSFMGNTVSWEKNGCGFGIVYDL